MRRFHLLTQYVWPDDAPTGIYVEHIADGLRAAGVPARIVSGRGEYRPGERRPPETPIIRVPHRQGRRGSLLSTAIEYSSVNRAFVRYLRRETGPGDVVLVTSAPPTSVFLHRQIRRLRARSVYWLQDFYPQLIRGIWDPPSPLVAALESVWRSALGSWNCVVKSGANLAYSGSNAVVHRNWNTVEPGPSRPARPRTALYSGNLGYGHDVGEFLRLCSELRDAGYEVTIRGDGPGMRALPHWIRAEPPLRRSEDLVRSYWEAEVHLVAADPRLTGALFPSKIWNSLAVGRPVRASGFAGAMAAELTAARESNLTRHRSNLVDYLVDQWRAASAEVR